MWKGRKMLRHPLIGVDIGSDQVRVSFPANGILISEPNAAKLSAGNRLTAVGFKAMSHLPDIDSGSEVVWPVRHGIMDDDVVLEAILRHIYPRLGLSWFQCRPQIISSTQSGVGYSQIRVVRDVIRRSMSGKIGFVPDLVAIGAGLQLQDREVLVNLGGGGTTIGVIQNFQVTECQRITCAGHQVDEQIQRFLFAQYSLRINLDQCRQIKHAMCLTSEDDTTSLLPWVRKEQRAEELLMTGAEYREIVKTALQTLVNEIRWFLRLSCIALDQEILMAGGTAQIPWLSSWLATQLNRSIRVIDDPQHAVIHGIGRIIEQMQATSHTSLIQTQVDNYDRPKANQ